MEGFAEEYLADTGFFHSGPEAWINVLKREEKYVKNYFVSKYKFFFINIFY